MHGVHTALVTPFDARGDVNLPAFERLCARQIDAGIHGLVPCGTTGESPVIATDEWSALVGTAIAVSAGRVPVTAGVGTNNTRTTVANCERAANKGVDYGLLVLPYYNRPNPNGLRAHLAEALKPGLRLVVYHVPGRTGQRLSPELLAELASQPGVAAVKEATGDLRYGADVIALTRTEVLSGDDFTFLPLMAMGGKGVISVVSNVDPAGTVAVYDHFAAGRLEEAKRAMYRIWKLTTFLFSDSSPAPCKAALAELSLCRPEPRLPLGPYLGPSCAQLLAELGLS